MMKVNFSAASLFVTLFLVLPASPAQDQKAPVPRDSKTIEGFEEDANHHPNFLLLEVLQFTAPYPGFYQKLSVNRNGDAFTARIVPDWAVQGSKSAKLEGALSDQIGQMLAQLDLTSDSLPEPEPDQCRTALVFYDGKAYKRYDFNGALPAKVEVILDLVRNELERQARLQDEEFLAHRLMIERTYGDWQNMIGVAVVSGARMRVLKETRGLWLTLTGHRKSTPHANPSEVSIYHALIFYPDGVLTGSRRGGGWTDDPLSTEVVSWDLPKQSGGRGAAETDKKVLEIKYQAIDGTVSFGGKAYQLGYGNVFVIHMSETWTPIVSQIILQSSEQATDEGVLDLLKSILRDDESIQRLE